MRKTGSRYLPNYSDTLEVLRMTQAQLSDASIEYGAANSEATKGRILERMEALCAMREDAGHILAQVSKAQKTRHVIAERVRNIEKFSLRPAA